MKKKAAPGNPEQIRRITYFENILREAEQLLGLENAGDFRHVLYPAIRELDAYYGSSEWRQDFADDEAGLLPKDLPRGVLSEDGIFNVLVSYRELEEASPEDALKNEEKTDGI